MQVGIDSFAAAFDENSRALNPADRLRQLVEQIEHADEVGLDAFGIGEHHRREFLDSAPAVILGAAAARTQRIRLTSAVTVLSAEDPVRAFQNFATLDLLSRGRAAMIVGRGSSIEAFPLFGFRPLIDLYREPGRQHGHSADQLKVGLHMLGYVGDTTQEAVDTFFPGYAKAMTDVGKERGWPPMTRGSFDAQRGPDGALLIGSPSEVVDKILRHREALGGVSRISFQMNVASLPQIKMMRAIDAIGAAVVPALGDMPAKRSAADRASRSIHLAH